MNTEQERAAFEAFASKHGLCVTEDGDLYRSHVVAWMWKAWQARAALQSQEYTAAIGEAGQTYLDQFKNAHALPAEFRWSELWAVMCVAANKGRTDATQSQDREDAERLDWLDSMNAKLNSHYGTTYRWKLVLSPNVVRLMSGAGGNGHVAAIDLHDSEAHGALSCREAIDHARRAEGEGK